MPGKEKELAKSRVPTPVVSVSAHTTQHTYPWALDLFEVGGYCCAGSLLPVNACVTHLSQGPEAQDGARLHSWLYCNALKSAAICVRVFLCEHSV